MASPIDPTVAALLGSAVGAVTAIVGTVIAAVTANARERRAYIRTLDAAQAERVRETYQLAINVVSLMIRGGAPTADSYGANVAQIALFGSDEVRRLVTSFLGKPPNERAAARIEPMVDAMKTHLASLEQGKS